MVALSIIPPSSAFASAASSTPAPRDWPEGVSSSWGFRQITDVLVRVQMLDGAHSTTLARPSRPWVDIVTSPGPLAVAGAYLSHGIEHILFGFDHLLFVLGLILIVRHTRMLLLTVTGFTVAHSITLSLATLGIRIRTFEMLWGRPRRDSAFVT
jgi:hypothetical protein